MTHPQSQSSCSRQQSWVRLLCESSVTRLDWALGSKGESKGVGRKEQLFAKALVCARYHVRPQIQARAVSKTVKLLLTWTPPRRQVGYMAPVCYSMAVPGSQHGTERKRGVLGAWVEWEAMSPDSKVRRTPGYSANRMCTKLLGRIHQTGRTACIKAQR